MHWQLEATSEGSVSFEPASSDPAASLRNSKTSSSRLRALEGSLLGPPRRRQQQQQQQPPKARKRRFLLPAAFLALASFLLLALNLKIPQLAGGRSGAVEGPPSGAPPSPGPPAGPLPGPSEPCGGAAEAPPEQPGAPPAAGGPPPHEGGPPPARLYDAWGLPLLHHFEEALPPELREGKRALAARAAALRREGAHAYGFSEHLEWVVAGALSGGKAEALAGLEVALKEVQPLKLTGAPQEAPRRLRVTKVLRMRYPKVEVEAQDLASGKLYSMAIRVFSQRGLAAFKSEQQFLLEAQQAAALEESVARQACGTTPAALAGSHKGLAVPLFAAAAAAAADSVFLDGFYVFGRVLLSERLADEVSLGALVQQPLPLAAKEYVAQRLLLLLLKLQQAGLSHNGLTWESLRLRPDGSFLLGDLAFCTRLASPLGPFAKLPGRRAEPQLLLRNYRYGEEAVPQANSDFWSLGVLLYELFTEGGTPYMPVGPGDEMEEARHFADTLLQNKVRPLVLVPKLKEADVPVRWRQLILRCLEPMGTNRISAVALLTEFSDIVKRRP